MRFCRLFSLHAAIACTCATDSLHCLPCWDTLPPAALLPPALRVPCTCRMRTAHAGVSYTCLHMVWRLSACLPLPCSFLTCHFCFMVLCSDCLTPPVLGLSPAACLILLYCDVSWMRLHIYAMFSFHFYTTPICHTFLCSAFYTPPLSHLPYSPFPLRLPRSYLPPPPPLGYLDVVIFCIFGFICIYTLLSIPIAPILSLCTPTIISATRFY